MNKLEEQLSIILEKSLNIAEKSGEFIIEQAPLLLQEFYKWHTASHIMGSLLFLLTLIPFIIFYKKADWSSGSDVFSEVASVVLGIVSLFTIIASMVNIYQLVFITVAPKLYLIEYFVK
mgnify:CR=1 FL=1